MRTFKVQIVFSGILIWSKLIIARDGIEAIDKAQKLYKAPSGSTFRVKPATPGADRLQRVLLTR